MKTRGKIRSLLIFLRSANLLRLFFLLLFLLVAGTVGLAFFEPNISLRDAMWWSMVTLTTVGYGDVAPATGGGRAIGVVIMLLGIGTLSTFTATIASILVEKKMKEDRGMGSWDFEDHLVMCEWNHRSMEILKERRNDPRTENDPIVLIADIEAKPVDDDLLYFIKGYVTEENLKRANLEKAKTVIILGDDKLEENSRDAKAVLSTLTVESVNPNVYTIVELVSGANVRHCKRAKADEVIVGSEFSSKLISSASQDHGISKVLSELLTSREGNDLFKAPAPQELVGKTFMEAFVEMKRTRDCITLALQRGSEGEVISNPSTGLKIEPGDYFILIAPHDKKYS